MKIRIYCILLISYLMIAFGYAGVLRTELNTGWEFKQARGANWYQANVPGVVHTDLINNNIIADPFFRMNERSCQWIDKEDWEYKTTFDISDDMFSKDSICLVFKGLDTYADIYLNNEKILITNNMYREWKVNCKSKLRKQGNVLRIYFNSPIKVDIPKFDASVYHYPADNDQSENGGLFNKQLSIYARKAPYHYGWDWGPRLVTSGIWRPIILEAWDNAKIEDVQIFQENVTDKSARIKATIEVISSKDQTGTVSINDAENNQDLANVQANLKKGLNKIAVTFTLKKPRLWWPNGLGEQYLYSFKTSLSISGAEPDSKVMKIGIRSLKLITQNPNGENTFHFEVNGVSVFMKGANYIPSDIFLTRVDAKKYERIILDAKNTNMNMLRVWGGGIYENDIFYDLCDKYGILIWQDFMFTCSMYPAEPEMLENIRQEAIQNLKRIRNHSCLALWCGNNEIDEAWFGWGWKTNAEKQSKEIAERVWAEYESVFHKLLPEVVKEYDPSTSYWKSSPIVENGRGDKHYWKVWQGGIPITEYAKEIYQFLSEYGFQSFPMLNTVKKYAPDPKEWDIYSEVMLLHQRSGSGNRVINTFMDQYYRKPKDFASFLYMSQILQADAIKIAEEAHRRNMPYCMGSLYWQIDDCWPVASWSSVDYYGNWKAQHYYTKRAFSEVLVSPFEEDGKLDVYIVSDRLKSIKATLIMKLITLDGKVASEMTSPVTIPANTSKQFLSEQVEKLLKNNARNEVVVYFELKEADKILSTNTYYFAKIKDIVFQSVVFSKEIIPVENGFEVVLKADKPAKGIYLEMNDSDNVFVSDNFFDLVPGQAVRIKVNSSLPLVEFEKQLKITSIRNAYGAE